MAQQHGLSRPIGALSPGDRKVLDWTPAIVLVAGIGAMSAPLIWTWVLATWVNDRHELLILGVSSWLLFRQRGTLAAMETKAPAAWPLVLIGASMLLQVAGRMVDTSALLMLSLVLSVVGTIGYFKGGEALRKCWFPIVFLFFAFPLPFELTLWLTGPLKEGVSAVATWLLHSLGLPVARSGVVMTVGQYQLLVLEACAGLQTMFTLEAMGLLYASLMNHQGVLRNALLTVLVVPVSFVANVVRVVVLALITYWFGTEAGQGYLHGAAGLMLFLAALALIVTADQMLGWALGKRGERS